jgi:hypothetical protein
MFLFGRSLKHNPRCIALDQQVQEAKARLAQLKNQRDAIARESSPRARRDDIIAELARNRCGDNYAREYEAQRNRNSSIFSFFSNEDSDDSDRSQNAPSYTSPPASGFTTLCVRLCDGFYYPISYATTQSQFRDDEAKCHAQCAAPAELYYRQTDQEAEQMVSLDGHPYTQLPNAFRSKNVFIRGCSCSQREYSQNEIAKSEESLRQSKRAEITPMKKVTSDAAAPAPATPPH